MKLIIDIDKKIYDRAMLGDFNITAFDEAVRNGTPLEEIPNPCIECSQNCCVCELNGENCECQKVYVVKEKNNGT